MEPSFKTFNDYSALQVGIALGPKSLPGYKSFRPEQGR